VAGSCAQEAFFEELATLIFIPFLYSPSRSVAGSCAQESVFRRIRNINFYAIFFIHPHAAWRIPARRRSFFGEFASLIFIPFSLFTFTQRGAFLREGERFSKNSQH
jgi:hypothetical protein